VTDSGRGEFADYLLDRLGAEARTRMQERLFRDDEAFDALLDAENDLLAEYAAGTLSAADRRAVEERLIHAPQQQNKLRVARLLARRDAARSRRPLHWRAWTARAAAVLMAAAAIWGWSAYWRARSQAATLAERLSRMQALARPPANAAPATLTLFPGSLRSPGAPGPFAVSGPVLQLQLVLNGAAATAAAAYRVEIRTRRGEVLWTETGLPPVSTPAGTWLSARIPVSALTAPALEAVVSAMSPGPPAGMATYYDFEIAAGK